MPIFDSFQQMEGVKQIIESLRGSLRNWKNADRVSVWSQYVEELYAFCQVPAFFGFFLKNKSSMELLFQLLAGLPDSSEDKKWEGLESDAVKFIYDTLASVFKSSNDESIRVIAIEKELIHKIFDRIGIVSKEVKRKYVKHVQIEEDVIVPLVKKESIEAKHEKKKGVGYGSEQTGQNQKWNTQEYVDKKRIRGEQLQSLLEIVGNFFDFSWKLGVGLSERLKSMVLESSLLPLLESAFRSASLLEMSKESELNQCYLRLARVVSGHRSLVPLLMPLPENYVPRQSESIVALLSQLNEVAQIFKITLTNETSDSVGKQISSSIIETYKLVQSQVDAYGSQYDQLEEETAEQKMGQILSLPLHQSYPILLKDLRFNCIQMREGTYDHHYASHIGTSTPSPAKMVRLAQEFADMSNSLPIEHTNSIFVRVDRERVDVMKAMVMGAAGTPYAHGAYVFDIYFDENYPQGPPKMNLSTTGGGKIRFNPNLYACGKVCLSLLGTWRGHASENWDPKISTLLQILVSTQAIIMSEDVYFNEPGFEGEAGTDEGERKNVAYSNIVKYGNVKYAILETLKNPPKGFEQVVQRHFYLKQNEILEEVNKWLKKSKIREASYKGLVHDHNSSWCQEFSKSKTRFSEMMEEAINEMKQAFAKLTPPSLSDLKTIKYNPKKNRKALPNQNIVVDAQEIDVTYDRDQQHKVMDVTDESVRDRWSRYIGAMGMDAVKKQSNAQVLLLGVGSLGIEIAKNIVLSGVKRLSIYDTRVIQKQDLYGQFFIGASDIGSNRAEACVEKVQQLNYYVQVDIIKSVPSDLKAYDVVVQSELMSELSGVQLSRLCRSTGVKLIISRVCGMYGMVMNDFGEAHVVQDKNGETPVELFIKGVSADGVVETTDRHNLEDGDTIILSEVVGMVDGDGKSLNGSLHRVVVVGPRSLKIGDINGFSPYERNGVVKQVKVPIQLSFKSLEECLESPFYDPTLVQSDFCKMDSSQFSFIAFRVLEQLVDFTQESMESFITRAMEFSSKVVEGYVDKREVLEDFFREFILSVRGGPFPPLSAYFGGVVSSEVIKSITNKFMPINQLYLSDCSELNYQDEEFKLQLLSLEKQMQELKKQQEQELKQQEQSTKEQSQQQSESTQEQQQTEEQKEEQKAEYKILEQKKQELIKSNWIQQVQKTSIGVESSLGPHLALKLQKLNLFMVGCGAIGCELLKNFSMLNIGTEGSITITDPDHIETSNLSRQFLFREKHIKKSKSQTAAAAAVLMNPALKGRIHPSLERVSESTENVFTDQFFEGLDVVANALDNVLARRYVDARCVSARVPLLESGTLGPKGHVQVVIPFQTESYGTQNDPVEEGEIPYCTLKMFPEETFHCVEFARDKFGKLFNLRPKAVVKILNDASFTPNTPEEVKQLVQTIKLVENAPTNYQQCIEWAVRKYQKYFVNDIKQLLYTYPLDHLNKDGRLFWTLPKRPPTPVEYSSEQELPMLFVSTLAFLRANLFGVEVPTEWRSQQSRNEMAKKANVVELPPWTPSEDKKQSISSEVQKQEKPQQEELQQEQQEDVGVLLQRLNKINKIHLNIQEFEKDNDQNGHIDFIHSFGNLRASNYHLEPMDWIGVKLKAGRIVPALATTTAAVAGLQTIELCKVIKRCKLDQMKNAFLNLAVPYVQLTEPGPPPTITLNPTVKVTLWDRWQLWAEDKNLGQLLLELQDKYQVFNIHIFIFPQDETYQCIPQELSCLHA